MKTTYTDYDQWNEDRREMYPKAFHQEYFTHDGHITLAEWYNESGDGIIVNPNQVNNKSTSKN